jgi:hypothetical protein
MFSRSITVRRVNSLGVNTSRALSADLGIIVVR